VWRGGIGADQHVASARAVIANGGVFAQMPEGTVSGPAGRIGPFRVGWAVIALRTDAPIVPFAMAGTEELYVGRRLVLEDPAARPASPASSAPAGTAADRRRGPAPSSTLPGSSAPPSPRSSGRSSPSCVPRTVDPPGHPRRLRRRLTWLFLRAGRLDRDDPTGTSAGSA